MRIRIIGFSIGFHKTYSADMWWTKCITNVQLERQRERECARSKEKLSAPSKLTSKQTKKKNNAATYYENYTLKNVCAVCWPNSSAFSRLSFFVLAIWIKVEKNKNRETTMRSLTCQWLELECAKGHCVHNYRRSCFSLSLCVYEYVNVSHVCMCECFLKKTSFGNVHHSFVYMWF